MLLEGKTAFISGAGRNSGRAIAHTFAREGATLALVAKEPGEQVKQVAKECEELGATAVALTGDVGYPEEAERLVAEAEEKVGPINQLVLTAAIRPHKMFYDYTYDEWHRVFSVNTHSAFYLSKAIVPGMIERGGGNIIALGSIGGFTPAGTTAVAVEIAAKHALHGFIKALAVELGPFNIRANVIALAYIENVRAHPEWYADAGGEPHSLGQLDQTPLRREGTPQEVANIALFLASEQSSYVTGAQILCTGGSLV